MNAILITFAALLLLRLLFGRKGRSGDPQSFGAALRDELMSWFAAAAVLIGVFALLLMYALLVGPIPQVHEW